MSKCFLDMDGVLVDFVEGYCSLKNLKTPYYDPDNFGKWDVTQIFIEQGHFEERDRWIGCNKDFWAKLRPMRDADGIVKLLEDRFGQKHIVILSRPVVHTRDTRLTAQCIEGKLEWLAKWYPQYYERVWFGKHKEQVAHAQSLLIDDSDENVENYKKAGGPAILVPRLWNSGHSIAINHSALDYIKYRVERQWQEKQ